MSRCALLSVLPLAALLSHHSRPQAGNHDSIEDARAALALYRKYEQLEAEGAVRCQLGPPLPTRLPHPDAPQVESAISKLYAEGHACECRNGWFGLVIVSRNSNSTVCPNRRVQGSR